MMRWLTPVRVTVTVFAVTTVFGAPYSWATPVFTGPTSPDYLDDFIAREIYIVQGAAVVNSFPVAYASPCSGLCESNLDVTKFVSANWFGAGNSGPSANPEDTPLTACRPVRAGRALRRQTTNVRIACTTAHRTGGILRS
jgi:hypothetical protein